MNHILYIDASGPEQPSGSRQLNNKIVQKISAGFDFIKQVNAQIEAIEWLNTTSPLSIKSLRGKVIAIHAFQMLCPGCVSHGIPQATAINELYAEDDVQVIGLHSVFEHHDVMTVDALKVFIHEYRLTFPIAVDQPVKGQAIPKTMENYQLRGTPSLILIDRKGRVRANQFGQVHDMAVGNIIGRLLAEPGGS